MTKTATLNIDKDLLSTVNGFFKKVLADKAADILLIPQDIPSGVNTVQTLVKDPKGVISANPFAFVLPANSASLLVKTTDETPGERIAAVFRPCELRAVLELAKLHQINLENVTLISVDCLGTFSVPTYAELFWDSKNNGLTMKLLKEAKEGGKSELSGKTLRSACQVCELPVTDSADVNIGILGLDSGKEIMLSANTAKGEKLLDSLGLELKEAEEPAERAKAISDLEKHRSETREALMAQIKEQVRDISGFLQVLGGCIKCHNCMKVCPICYCKECFFDSDIFKPSPRQYMDKAQKRGVLRMPLDTALYHIGRMNHMITSCVACGQCENACPSNIPLLAIYLALGKDVQALFDYLPGKSLDDELPLATFKEEELSEV
ncbi:MAG: Coenzyme F420 hydrogenase/dehydrogenase, beta subunit C-terminal domain [Thermoplasmata archaeon]|nr:MAG: Coenzyme F420 hydrogenase/dehydrogenase, beta subunit C-terminal domain [Thermoplasmata archaeon]